jgi:hypothetical protein
MSKRITVSLIAALAILAAVASAGAGSSTPTGEKLGISFGGTDSRTILANTPFFVKGGFRVGDGDTTSDVQQSQFTLSVDGVKQNGVIIQEFSDTTPRVLTGKFSLFNFPSGLPVGTYVFHIEYVIRGAVIQSRNVTIVSVASCQYGFATLNDGTTSTLLCGPPPA